MKVFRTIVLFTFFAQSTLYAQVINAYAKVTAVAGNDISLSNVNQTNHSFIVGEYVVIMQMQDDVIGSNTNNDAAFGDLSAISSAGLYEIEQITAIDGNGTLGYSAATPATMSLAGITNAYNIGSNGSVQIISFRQMAAGDYTTTSSISALDWDGNVGGVVAIHVPGVFTVNHSISANSNGFRGGLKSVNYSGPQCTGANVTRYRENNTQLGYKGEGIYKSTDVLHTNGRAKILNGGGGGSHHNGGGGGGGNFTTGGLGGNGYNNCTTNPAGGFGGISLSAYIDGSRAFMGGGAGGGQQNNTQGRDGSDGGGIILIKATEITTGACGSVSITANGGTAATNGTNDGGGGGGAGGSIVFWVDTWNIQPSCTMTIAANGGNGSSSLNGSPHAGGGAGGQGTIVFNGTAPSTNVTVTTNNGTPGCNNNSSPCNNIAGYASGSNNAGILSGTNNPLPVGLIEFSAILNENQRQVLLDWTTASELNNDYFEILKSSDGINWSVIGKISGQGNSSVETNYSFQDNNVTSNIVYYRLRQVDFDGAFSFSNIEIVQLNDLSQVDLYPNPVENVLSVSSDYELIDIIIYAADGRQIYYWSNSDQNFMTEIDLTDLESGPYFVLVKTLFSYSVFSIVRN